MTILKIQHIKAIGKFRRYGARGNVALKKYNLVFGENARGKTTMCAILRSLSENDGLILIGRRTLGDAATPEVIIELADGQARFKDGAWQKPVTDIRIFDNQYILENIYTDESIGTDQRRNLCRVLLGRDGASLGARYNAIDAEITQKNKDIRVQKNRISLLSEGLSVDEFVALKVDDQIDEKIIAKNKEVEGVRQIDAMLVQKELEEVLLPRYPSMLDGLLRRSIDDVSVESEAKILHHLQTHKMEEAGARWIAEGLPHIAEDSCPFCGQSLAAVDLISDFKSYFTDAFNALRDDLVKYRNIAEKIFSDDAIELIRSRIDSNLTRHELWRQYLTADELISLNADEAVSILTNFRGEILLALDEKLRSLISPGELSKSYGMASERFLALVDQVAFYNESALKFNAAVGQFKERAKAKNLQEVEGERRKMLATKSRYGESGQESCQKYLELENQKAELENEKRSLRTRIDEYSSDVMAKYADHVNVLLKRFRAGFVIDSFRLEYSGRIPNSSFGVIINDTPVEMGSDGSPLDVPSFRNTLSGGDRVTLALAFFVAQLNCDSEREGAVVVFDDPFSSQDHFRRTCTIGEMVRIGKDAAQILVFSHDKKFLKDIWDYPLPPGQRVALGIEPVGQFDSQLCEWEIDKEAESEDAGNRNALVGYFLHYAGEPGDVIQKLRPVLETHMRRVAPEELRGITSLGDMIDRLRNAATPLSSCLPDIEDVNSYTRKYMHGDRSEQNPRPPISKEELHGFVDRVLRVVGALR